MLKLKATFLLLAIFALIGVSSQAVQADSAGDRSSLFVVLIDRQALAGSQNNTDLAESFVGLLSTLRDGQQLAFVTADNPTKALEPAIAGSAEFKSSYKEVIASLASSDSAPRADLIDSLAYTLDMFDLERAAPGSTLYVVTGGDSQVSKDVASERLTVILDEYKSNQWPIVGIGLPGPSTAPLEFLERASTETGGDLFALSVPEGFKELSDSILREEAKGALTELGQGELAPNEVLTSSLDIAPGTLEATLVFFKQGPSGSLRLRNPSGFEASQGDRTLSSVIETPFVVMWRLIDPVPGEWTVDIRGTEGQVSAWHYTANKLGVEFVSYNSVPFDQPVPLVAFVSDGRDRVLLEGIELRARITDLSGSILVYELNDNGELGDASAGDGYYSTTISPFGAEGDYKVQLELYWPEYDYVITSQELLSARPFPTIEIEELQTENLELGERTKVATALVNVKGQPYAIPTRDLTVDTTSHQEQAGILEVLPQRLVNQGQAWAFDVFFTPTKEDLHTLIFRLDMEYAGRKYSFASDSIVMSSLVPPPPPAPVVVPPPEPPAAPPPPPAPAPEPVQTFPVGLLAIPAVIGVGLLIVLIYFISRARPYGYLYNDRGELLVDFSSLQRRAMAALFSKNSVQGSELGLNELEGVSFSFSKGRVDIRSNRTEPTVRVNNRPLIEGEEAILHDNSWIGTQGKLFSFLRGRMTMQPEPGVGDD